MGFWYSSTPFQSVNGTSSSSSIHHNRNNVYNYSVFPRLVSLPPTVGNFPMPFLMLFSLLSASTILPSYLYFMVACLLHLSVGLGFVFFGFPYPSVPLCFPQCFWSLYCFVSMESLQGYILAMKPLIHIVLWVTP